MNLKVRITEREEPVWGDKLLLNIFFYNRDASNLFCVEMCQFWVWAKNGLAHKEVFYWEKEKLEKLLTVIQC